MKRFTISLIIHFYSILQSCPSLCDRTECSIPGSPVYHQLPELAQTHVHRVGDAIQPSHPLSSPLLPSIIPSIRVLSNESDFSIRWLKHWSFGFSISTFNEYSGLVSFRIDQFDFISVQRTLKSLLQHHSSKLNYSALSYIYIDIYTLTSIYDCWKTHSFEQIDLCRQSNDSPC